MKHSMMRVAVAATLGLSALAANAGTLAVNIGSTLAAEYVTATTTVNQPSLTFATANLLVANTAVTFHIRTLAGTVATLPAPADISVAGVAAAGIGAVTEAIGGNQNAATSIGGAIDNIGSGISQFKDDVKVGVGNEAVATDIINKQIAASAVNIFGANVTVNQLLARGNGEIINPNMELLFGGPTLRNFRFNFKLTPRNEKEAEQIKLIIRAFKRNMATIWMDRCFE